MIKLVVGLGNPGKNYTHTRHNVGFLVLNRLEQGEAPDVVLFRPDSFMNQSGGPVSQIARKKGIQPSEILVVCDDFSIPLGTLRLRFKGSSGGHNGLDSILNAFGTQDIPRLRVGIGPVPEGQDPANFVLASFASREKPILDDAVALAADAVRTTVTQGFETAMNKFNKKGESA